MTTQANEEAEHNYNRENPRLPWTLTRTRPNRVLTLKQAFQVVVESV